MPENGADMYVPAVVAENANNKTEINKPVQDGFLHSPLHKS